MDGTAGSGRGEVDLADAFEALDAAAILFDERWRCVAANRRLVRSFGAERARAEDWPRGRTLDAVADDLFRPGSRAPDRVRGPSGRDALCTDIRSYRRDFDLVLPDGRIVVGSAAPTSKGGCLVTLRDRARDRIGETEALALLAEAFEQADMGMIVWNAALDVQMANAAWGRMLAPAQAGMSGRDYAARLIGGGLFDLPPGTTPEAMVDGLVRQALQRTMRMEGTAPDGRRLMLYSFRTPAGGIMGLAADVTAIRAAEAEVGEALGEIVESLGEGVALYDADLRLRMSNDALHRMAHGDHPRMECGTHLAEHCAYVVELGGIALPAGTSLDAFTEAICAAARGHARDVPVGMADGRILHLSSFPTPVGGYLLTLRDVTEKLRVEAAEREADTRVRTIVESLGEGVALYDAERRLLLNNPAFRRLVMGDRVPSEPGMTVADEITGCIEAGLIALPEGRRAADVVDWIEACIDEHRVGVELPMADGRVLEVSNFPAPDDGFLVAVRDVTARKRAEEATREFDQLIRTIVDATPTTLMVSRLEDGRVIYAPPATLEQARGLDMTRDVTDPEARRRYLDALLPSGRLTDWPMRFRARDGRVVDCLTSARVIEYRGERLIVSSSLDVTERLALQKELERQRDALHQNEKLSALGELLAGVAHELNNPLSIVVGHAVMLQDKVSEPDIVRRVEKISTAAQRSARIVKMFLAMARQRPMRLEPTDLNDLLREAVDIAASGLRGMGAAVELDLDPALPAVSVDPDQIVQVISNLVVNAEHALAGRPFPRLTLSTRCHERSVELCVTDNGAGMAPEVARRVFEPFFTTKDVGTGTGVGLAFCHRIVTTHGGRLGVVTAPGAGAAFTMSLPLEPSDAPDGPLARPLRHRSARVLVVDDEAEVGEMIGDVLARAGHDVRTATGASAALAIARAFAPDCILSDIRMPGMDGPAFLDALCATAPALAERVAFLTGDAMGEGIDAFLARSGRPFAEKPLRPDEILGIVDDLLRSSAP